MEDFKVGDWVVPLFEEEKRVVKVLSVGKALEVETDEGSEISASCNYRHATKTEIDEEIQKRNNPIKLLTKQQKLDVLSKAIDEGAHIDINFHGNKKEDAERIINEVGETTELEATHSERGGFQWYKLSVKKFEVVAFYDREYMVEDVVRTIEE